MPNAPASTGSASASDVPSDFRPSKDVALPSTAQSALTVAKGWMAEKQTPAPGADGRVLYTYGAGMPTVVCAPMRVCVVELEAGEHLSGEPHVGDSVRWVISPAMAGSGRQETPMLVIKPKQAGLDTTLLITTDRRAYYLRLVSKPDDYLARVAFAYPEEETESLEGAPGRAGSSPEGGVRSVADHPRRINRGPLLRLPDHRRRSEYAPDPRG